jgi:hypothetical protein
VQNINDEIRFLFYNWVLPWWWLEWDWNWSRATWRATNAKHQ